MKNYVSPELYTSAQENIGIMLDLELGSSDTELDMSE